MLQMKKTSKWMLNAAFDCDHSAIHRWACKRLNAKPRQTVLIYVYPNRLFETQNCNKTVVLATWLEKDLLFSDEAEPGMYWS